MLDLSAAFDTIDKSVLLNRLTEWFGITGCALKWFSSYLIGRSQAVKVNDTLSSDTDLSCGVPQGSVLGPLLFSLYTSPLSKVINRFTSINHLLITIQKIGRERYFTQIWFYLYYLRFLAVLYPQLKNNLHMAQ